MADKFQLEIATPERLVVREQVSEAQVPAANGYLGVLPGHAPLLAALGTGELTYLADGRRSSLSVDGGWVEVLPDRVRVLATHAEKASEIDAKRAEEALHRAEELLTRHPDAGVDVARALNAMTRAQARLAAAKHQ
jgi:F-type H+-transporting ATPase subunit epsilon